MHHPPIYHLAKRTKPYLVVMASAAEAEVASLYITAKKMVPLRNTLIEMGEPQPKSPIQTDNSIVVGFTNKTIVTKAINSLDM